VSIEEVNIFILLFWVRPKQEVMTNEKNKYNCFTLILFVFLNYYLQIIILVINQQSSDQGLQAHKPS
jgi:hypothetical protein